MSIKFPMQSVFFNNVRSNHTQECTTLTIESASTLDTHYSRRLSDEIPEPEVA